MVVATKQLGEEVRSEELGVGIARTPAHQRFIHPPRSSASEVYPDDLIYSCDIGMPLSLRGENSYSGSRCYMPDADCRRNLDGGSWTAEDWESLPLDFTSNMMASGKKQYYLDMESALYLLGGGNNGRYYDAATGRFLSEDPTKEAGGDENLFRYVGNDPVNNLDPSGHKKQPPPQHTFHPPQEPPAQNPNAHVNVKTPTTQHGAASSAERGILKQADSLGDAPSWAVPKVGEPLAGPASGGGDQNNTTGYTPAQLEIIHARLARIFHGGPALQYVSYARSPVYDSWIAQAQTAQPQSNTSGQSPFTPTQDQQDIAQTPSVNIGGVNMPTDIAQNSQAAFNAKQSAIGQATAAGDFQKADYLIDHEFDIPKNLPTPNVKLPPGASLIPGMQNLANMHADWMTGHYSRAKQNFKFGIAAMGVAVITGALARDLDITPGSLRNLAKLGRLGKQPKLRQLVDDPNVSSADRGWIRQEINAIKRGNRRTIRVPPGKQLAHVRGFPAKGGFGYKYSKLQEIGLHKLQHSIEGK